MPDRDLSGVGAVLAALGAVALVVGAGLVLGGAMGAWSYGEGLGRWWHRIFVFCRRWGAVVALTGIVLIGVALLTG